MMPRKNEPARTPEPAPVEAPTFTTLADAAAHSEREGLRRLRRRLAEVIDDPETPPYAIANLSRQLAGVMHRLSDMGEGKENEPPSMLDKLRAERAARRAELGIVPTVSPTAGTYAPAKAGPKPRNTAPKPRL